MTDRNESPWLDRRTFLKGTVALGVYGGLMGAGLSACSPAKPAASAAWKAGTYTTNVTGHNAPFTIDVTFSDKAITSIDFATNQESLGVGASALEKLSEKALQYQSSNLDAVTGATLSSMCFQQGLKECADQALSLIHI